MSYSKELKRERLPHDIFQERSLKRVFFVIASSCHCGSKLLRIEYLFFQNLSIHLDNESRVTRRWEQIFKIGDSV